MFGANVQLTAVAEYDYEAQSPEELTLAPGVKVLVMSQDESGEWWFGTVEETGASGYFPKNYVSVVNEGKDEPIEIHDVHVEPTLSTSNGRVTETPTDVTRSRADFSGNAALVETERNKGLKRPKQSVREKESTTRYGVWACHMGRRASIFAIFEGVALLVLLFMNAPVYPYPNTTDLIVSCGYCFTVGFLMLWYEHSVTVRTTESLWLHAFLYTFFSVPAYFRLYTVITAVHFTTISVAYAVAAMTKEPFALNEHGTQQTQLKRMSTKKNNILSNTHVTQFFLKLKRTWRKQTFVFLYLLLCIALGMYAYKYWRGKVELLRQVTDDVQNPDIFTHTKALSDVAPFAKIFGYLLDMNCAFILLPVCPSLIRILYDLSTQSHTFSQRVLRAIFSFIPLDKALAFHKSLGWLIFICALLHGFFHLINYGGLLPTVRLSPRATIEVFGIEPWITGPLIFMVMLVLYGGVPVSVKRYHFELFFFTHRSYVVFFILLLIHGNKMWNPNFWKWFTVPVLLFIADRVHRLRTAYRSVYVTSITIMEEVISLEFDRDTALPNGFKEGQYLFVNCPTVSKFQWHPFTISSAPQENQVSVHIRIMDKGSWTREVADYFSLLVPGKAAYIEFRNPMKPDELQGKSTGPNGKPLLRIFGPRSAPTQHIGEYSVDMIIGSGIGVTPLCSTMKSTVQHRWKHSIGKSFPEYAYFHFVCSHRDVESFRWFICILKDVDDEYHNMKAKNTDSMCSTKLFEFHFWITSSKNSVITNVQDLPPRDDVGFWGGKPKSAKTKGIEMTPAPWTEQEMYYSMRNPPSTGCKQLGSIRIYGGRPDWQEQFNKVGDLHSGQKIGVLFCGNPLIAKDLKTTCIEQNYRRQQSKTSFVLHKEQF